jgi:hypothetical protein
MPHFGATIDPVGSRCLRYPGTWAVRHYHTTIHDHMLPHVTTCYHIFILCTIYNMYIYIHHNVLIYITSILPSIYVIGCIIVLLYSTTCLPSLYFQLYYQLYHHSSMLHHHYIAKYITNYIISQSSLHHHCIAKYIYNYITNYIYIYVYTYYHSMIFISSWYCQLNYQLSHHSIHAYTYIISMHIHI